MINIKVPVCNTESLESEISRINSRLGKKGIDSRIYFMRKANSIESFNLDSLRKVSYEVTEYLIELPELKLPGNWKLIGVLDHESAEKPVMKSIPGETLPSYLRDTDQFRCDHCKIARRRKDTFAIRNSEGEIRVVGRTCIADYLGIDPTSTLYLYDIYTKLFRIFKEKEEYSGPAVSTAYPLGDFLVFSARVIRNFGYTSKRVAEENETLPTSDLIWDLIDDEDRRKKIELSEEISSDLETAQFSLNWLFSLSKEELEKSEYLYNLSNIVKTGYVTSKTKGYVASLISTFNRVNIEKKESRTSDYVGEIGKRIKGFSVTINGIREINGYYGTCFLVKFSDGEGNNLTWFGSSDPRSKGFDRDSRVTIDFTVKKHEIYRDKKQTKINRVTFR